MPRPHNPDQPVPRSLRVPTAAWDKALARARAENLTMSEVCADLVEGYARGIYHATPPSGRADPADLTVRSMRVPSRAWKQALRIAQSSGTSMRSVVAELIKGYAAGAYALPKKRIVRNYSVSE